LRPLRILFHETGKEIKEYLSLLPRCPTFYDMNFEKLDFKLDFKTLRKLKKWFDRELSR